MEFQLINLVYSNLDWDKNKIPTYLNIQFSFNFHQSHKMKFMSSILHFTKNWRKLKDLMEGNLIPTFLKEFLIFL